MAEAHDELPIGADLTIINAEPRKAGGTWLTGTVAGHGFRALIFQEHAINPSHEISKSFISKLWVGRLLDKKVVFNWDRGLETGARDLQTKRVVGFLTDGRLNEILLRLESSVAREQPARILPQDNRQTVQDKSQLQSDQVHSRDATKRSKSIRIDRNR